MRIAVSGAHRTGKTTLVEELARVLPTHGVIEEPYSLLEEEGHAFSDPPSLEDFELQLARSIQSIADSEGDLIFDRCPADLLAYLLTHERAEAFDLEHWLPRARSAMERLDLIVFVPLEPRKGGPGEWRRRVDAEVRDIVLGDRWDFGVDAVEVSGTLQERVGQVLVRAMPRVDR